MYLDGVPQVRDERRIDSLHDLRCNLAPVDPFEQADPLAEKNRRQRDGELIYQARVEVLDDGVGTSRDPDVLASGDLTRLPQRTLDPVVDEVERGPARALPGTANLAGQDEDGVWKGASSGQKRSPPSNIRLPMMLTPVRLKVSSRMRLSWPVSPPSPSCRFSRKNRCWDVNFWSSVHWLSQSL